MADQPDNTSTGDTVYCAHCGTDNARGGYSCTRCGERLVEVTVNTASPLGLVSCASCGNANNSRAAYCWVCGTDMKDAVRISPVAPATGTGENASTSEEPGGRAARDNARPEARKYEPEVNPISVPSADPKKEQVDLRGPVSRGEPSGVGSGSGSSQDLRIDTDRSPGNTSGTRDAEVPQELKRWNWAAFLMPSIWGIFSGVPLAALLFGAAFLPWPSVRLGILVIASLFLGMRGNELAWRGRKWRSVEHFQAVQRQWTVWTVTIFIVATVILVLFSLSQGTA